VLVKVNAFPPFGLLMLTAELAGNALNRAAAKLACVDDPL